MTRTAYYTATTLDGFIADDEDSLAWLFVQDQDAKGPLNYDDFIAGVGALVMGRTTYEWIRAHNQRTGDAWAYDIPAWVMTHRDLPGIEGADVRFAQGDAAAVHADMAVAADGKDIWVVGGGDLAGQFADAGLLDEVITYVAPVTLGSGRPLLPRRLDLRLDETQPNGAFITARFSVLGPGTWGT
ncbi:dihydrofolate reductase family protein [Nocardioides sp.]|uniref:dihydrofolate reductase family protein n=1 Tax=Nocardioides sp. TaxID=35761 RepID=UPI001A1EF1B5|nr:dihydrofolate reductase family protein [Nocardioides sp.]MBJ7359332.1 dihydrofolate reductase family protein [Nocardioides sp.]